jgi:hypothetical protein
VTLGLCSASSRAGLARVGGHLDPVAQLAVDLDDQRHQLLRDQRGVEGGPGLPVDAVRVALPQALGTGYG